MFQVALIVGGLLAASLAGSGYYITVLHEEIGMIKANEILFKTKIAEQNKAIQDLVNKQETTLKQVTQLERQKQEAQTEANKLRKTFAKHDLGNLALNKPGLIEKIVNKGTKKVIDELVSVSTHTPDDPDTTD